VEHALATEDFPACSTAQVETFEARGSRLLKTLIVDDNPDDRSLVIRELQKTLENFQPVEIADLKMLKKCLEKADFELVVTDYRLYWSDGLKVLNWVKRLNADIPVVMFTGTGNEEIAVEAMKAGVSDYILKSPANFQKLRASAQSALRLRQQKIETEAAELRYKNLFDTVPVGLFRCAPSGLILDVNPALAAILGYSDRKELLGKNFASFHPAPEDFPRWREELEREGSVAFIETRFKNRIGPAPVVEIHARALRDPESRQMVYEGSVEDISERKHAEQEREKMIGELRENHARIKTLTGLLPICASCKKIRDKEGTWNALESYIEHHSEAHFTHSFCPECVHRLYPEVFLDRRKF
jgi:PAS domain S-box-containing protein